MSVALGPSLDPLYVVYVVVFALAAVACFLSVRATDRIEDPDTRRGLAALLLTSGGWASAYVGFLLAPTVDLALGFYTAGLIVGIATVGPWLYFCSAYTGRTLHREPTLRRLAVAVFVVIVAVKLTNPIHHQYYTARIDTTPFVHLAIRHHIVHWITMGLAYSLSMVGYFMLVERLFQVRSETKPLFVLVGVTGLPVALDVLGYVTPHLLNLTYEPLGVAVFAVGVLFVYIVQLQAIQVTRGHHGPVILVDDDDRIREFNDSARTVFDELRDGSVLGEPLWATLPTVAEAVEADASVVELQRSGETRYYHVTENAFAADQTQLGQLIVLDDVTEREGYRRELERQNERLETFASMVSHDLRNPLNVAMGRLELARDAHDDDNLETVADALDRMETLIEDVLALARQGQPIDETDRVSLAALAESSWEMVETDDATLTVEDDVSFRADADRVKQLLENLYRNALTHGRSDEASDRHLTIRVGAFEDGFYVEDDGVGIPVEERETVFESGYTTDEHGTGFGLAIVAEIVGAHGWTIDATESAEGGARFEISGVEAV